MLDMADWTIYVPPFNDRAILMVGQVINGTILITLCVMEGHLYKGCSIIFGVFTGMLFWSESDPSLYRDVVKRVDQGCILFSVLIHIAYFKYYIQYGLILIAIGLFMLEIRHPPLWLLFHISIYLCLMTAFLSSHYNSVYECENK